jgi:hypothetical protein
VNNISKIGLNNMKDCLINNKFLKEIWFHKSKLILNDISLYNILLLNNLIRGLSTIKILDWGLKNNIYILPSSKKLEIDLLKLLQIKFSFFNFFHFDLFFYFYS